MNDSGYTLEQLLAWCVEDRLIDDFSFDGETVSIRRGADVNEYTYSEGLRYVKSLIRKNRAAERQADPA